MTNRPWTKNSSKQTSEENNKTFALEFQRGEFLSEEDGKVGLFGVTLNADQVGVRVLAVAVRLGCGVCASIFISTEDFIAGTNIQILSEICWAFACTQTNKKEQYVRSESSIYSKTSMCLSYFKTNIYESQNRLTNARFTVAAQLIEVASATAYE